ncbi:hydrolase 1, exosortase A system-associated [Tsuneonella sp. CC-YZS046]|uniref:hydrolase 1, exosortase A system-associated n=1 Tax=Tsuneonella sp. CC-YZS046 TaxID=3042152 RepID=UPI002D79B2E2|nr:hydrolase 1, exosortase A system-associated [Tsuneonella sp. CC-YZS046]WRO67868.1 hydrolase 1, exosortase A system-associated [Tsuneonella sp. CC-YZS046]
MMRKHLDFDCAGHRLAATLDEAPGKTGLLMVSGGNETRAGAFSGMAALAARIADHGYPVFRFDRRGVGDSEGRNRGFRDAAADIAAAIAAFRAEAPQLQRIYGFGNCDGASALMLASGQGLDGLLLANPWTIENDAGGLPPAAIRSRYMEKLRDPAELLRLLKGQVSIAKLARGLRQAIRPPAPPSSLAMEIRNGLGQFTGPVMILLAECDRTAQAFIASWDKSDPRIARCPDATHAFAEPHARDWIFNQIIKALSDE